MDASKTLRGILSLIDKDVRQIKKTNRGRGLDAETALTLSRYASTLNGIIGESWKAKEKEKKKLERKSTEELVAIYQEQMKTQTDAQILRDKRVSKTK
jgi:MarR-like DNA-binding transcriptional regulator SgrR of sgrS sRNA